VALSLLFFAVVARADDHCWVCGGPIGDTVYLWKDEVAGVKRTICEDCSKLTTTCYVCGLPVKSGYTEVGDGRILCARDAKSVLLDEHAILDQCEGIKAPLNDLFGRFLTFPDNVRVQVADRVTLLDLFKVPGNDYTCPNVLGFIAPETNDEDAVEFSMRVLSGQSPAATRATCAHEFTHAWMMANLSGAREKALDRDAKEGFCELVAFMLMRAQGETAQMANLRTNRYTRGQIDLFIEAEQRFGFNDVVDWVRYGEDGKLRAGQVERVRNVKMPVVARAAPVLWTNSVALAKQPDSDCLVLKSVSLGGKSPLAQINNCLLGVGETGKVTLATTNLLIRCKAIRADAVLIEAVGSGQTQELRFGAGSGH
jgi:hypothetical protein